MLIGAAVLYWPRASHAVTYGPLAMMPAISTNGGALNEEGLHFDETNLPGFGGYDYSAAAYTPAWIRGARETQFYPSRYMYWNDGTCKVTGRLQLLISGSWYDYWQYDVHVLDIYPGVSGTQYTQVVQFAGQWLYVTVGSVANPVDCPPNNGAHAHLSVHDLIGPLGIRAAQQRHMLGRLNPM